MTGVETFKKLLNEGQAGDNVGLLLRGIKRQDVERGQLLCKPGTVKPSKKFEAEIYCLTKEEGGRHTPFFSNYRPQVCTVCLRLAIPIKINMTPTPPPFPNTRDANRLQ